VASAGVSVEGWKGLSGSARLRYFGPRSLTEDGTVRSDGTTLVNLEAGYRLARGVRLILDVFNLFDAEASDIDYFYASRLPGEPAAADDVHFHPTLPRTARIGLQFGF
jgi:outer membrane receptor protein involved in Fe transport